LKLIIRQFEGLQDYTNTWQAMQQFTQQRDENTADEIWLLEHHPVYTLGRNGKREHLLNPKDIPIVPIDRGGQVTYHGPGQLIAYLLLHIRRLNIGIRHLVSQMEDSIVNTLADYGIHAVGDRDAPGVYVKGKKIAALGLRVTRGYTYHGLSFNIDMDLSPFNGINPCGYAELEVTQCKDVGITDSKAHIINKLTTYLSQSLGYHPEQIQYLQQTQTPSSH